MPFEKKLIPFAATHSFTELVLDYLTEDEKLKSFYAYSLSAEGFKIAIEKRKSIKVDRNILVEVIEKQYSSIADKSTSVNSNINLLLNKSTFTVTTGHQLNIFTGPLYFIYKIFSAINLAEQLKKDFPEFDFVPVYWMASEDHDFAEINHINVFDKKIEWQQQHKGATGKIPTASIKETIDELKTILGESQNSKDILDIFYRAYIENPNLTDATRNLVNQLFGKYGLIVLDASDKQLKELFIPHLKKDLLEQVSFNQVSKTTARLNSFYKTQVHARPVNLFYMQDGFRERLEEENSVYKVLNTELIFNKEELLAELEKHPENFSPNVILRPLYQETILPNIAYVGGGAEISYWMQYKSMFEAFDTFFPVLVLRDSVQLIDSAQLRKIKGFGIELEELFLSYDELVKILLSKTSNENLDISSETTTIENLFDNLYLKVSSIDPTLSATVNAEKQKVLNGLKVLEDKTTKSLKRKHETSLTQLKSIKEKLFPGNGLQERHVNLSTVYTKYGDGFFDALKKSLNPMQRQFIILAEKE